MYAIIETGGKQYRVAQGDLLQVELLDPGAETVTFQEVRLLSNGRETVLGTPRVDGASVTAKVVGTGRLPKILVFKKKRRKHYKRTIGHRQYFTAVRIEAIDAAEEKGRGQEDGRQEDRGQESPGEEGRRRGRQEDHQEEDSPGQEGRQQEEQQPLLTE